MWLCVVRLLRAMKQHAVIIVITMIRVTKDTDRNPAMVATTMVMVVPPSSSADMQSKKLPYYVYPVLLLATVEPLYYTRTPLK